jgi:hypothetical protein
MLIKTQKQTNVNTFDPYRITISVDQKLETYLNFLRQDFPLSKDSDIFKMLVVEKYNQQMTDKNSTAKKIRDWADALPVLELTKKQQTDLDASIVEMKNQKNKGYSDISAMMSDIMNQKI